MTSETSQNQKPLNGPFLGGVFKGTFTRENGPLRQDGRLRVFFSLWTRRFCASLNIQVHIEFLPAFSMGLLVFGCDRPCLPELSTFLRNECSVGQQIKH